MSNVDRNKAIRTVTNWVTKEVTQEQFEILVDYVMENGVEAFKRSSMLKRINRGDMEGAIEEFPPL